MSRMNIGGPEWRKWCGMYEGWENRRRIRAERRKRRDADPCVRAGYHVDGCIYVDPVCSTCEDNGGGHVDGEWVECHCQF